MESDEHCTSHSVLPGFSSQQTALQSPSVATSVRGIMAALAIGSIVDVDVEVAIDITQGVDIGVGVDVAGIDVEKPPLQERSHSTVPSPRMLARSVQTAVQPPLVTVTTVCLLARTGLSVTLLALTVHSRPMRLKTTDFVIRILPMAMTLMEGKKNVQVV